MMTLGKSGVDRRSPIEEADTVVAIGNGETTHKGGRIHRFAFCDVFTFTGDGICRVESYLVPLQGGT